MISCLIFNCLHLLLCIVYVFFIIIIYIIIVFLFNIFLFFDILFEENAHINDLEGESIGICYYIIIVNYALKSNANNLLNRTLTNGSGTISATFDTERTKKKYTFELRKEMQNLNDTCRFKLFFAFVYFS